MNPTIASLILIFSGVVNVPQSFLSQVPNQINSPSLKTEIVTDNTTENSKLEILGDCAGENCGELLVKMREAWPEMVQKYEADCQGDRRLGLAVYQDPIMKVVSFQCWDPPENGSSWGSGLGILPYPGETAPFTSHWQCVDSQCEKTVDKLKKQYPVEMSQAEFTCATKGGNLYLSTSTDGVYVECGFFVPTFVDENGDGIADWDKGTSAGISVGTFKLGGS